MSAQHRIRLARRHAGISQATLASAIGVHRSAVSHWESSQGKLPSAGHLQRLALITGVQFEWLATGRGRMQLTSEATMESVAAADALLVDDPLEMRLLRAFRDAPLRARAPLVEIAEQLASTRTGRIRSREPRFG